MLLASLTIEVRADVQDEDELGPPQFILRIEDEVGMAGRTEESAKRFIRTVLTKSLDTLDDAPTSVRGS